MSALVHINSQFDQLRVSCDDDEPTIWVRGRNETVSLSLSARDRTALRQALDAADAHETKVIA